MRLLSRLMLSPESALRSRATAGEGERVSVAHPAGSPTVADQFWFQPLFPGSRIGRDVVAFLVILVVAGLLRFWELGDRTFHGDEAWNAVLSYHLATGNGIVPDLFAQHGRYVFELNALTDRLFGVRDLWTGRRLLPDPAAHGPLLFELNALVYIVLGVSDTSARLAPAVVGTLLVGLPFFLRRQLGRTGAIVAATLLALSPSILYYSRFLRHDIYQIFLMLLLVVAVFGYLERRTRGTLLLATAVTSLAFSDKADSYFLLVILPTFLLFVSGRDVLNVIVRGKPSASAATDPLVLLGTLILPLFAGAAYVVVRGADELTIDTTTVVSFVVLGAIGTFVGLRWNRSLWLQAALLFWGIYLVLNSVFFTDPAHILLMLFGYVQYWIGRQDVARGGQPWFYYLLLLLLYEFVVVGTSLVGIPYWLRRRTTFTNFLLYWCLASLLLWGWASEKMPWMVIEMVLPFCLLAAATLGRFIEATVTIRRANLLGVRLGFTILAIALLVVLAPFSAYTAVRASFTYGDVPVEMFVYTQTTPDVVLVMRKIDNLARQSGKGVGGLAVAYDASLSTPFEWYLRDYASRASFDQGNPPPDAAVVLAGESDSGLVALRLGSAYESHEYRFLWWFPEDETYKTWTLSSVVQGLLNPSQRLALWRYVVYREPPAPLGGNTFDVFVRRDLAPEFSSERRSGGPREP